MSKGLRAAAYNSTQWTTDIEGGEGESGREQQQCVRDVFEWHRQSSQRFYGYEQLADVFLQQEQSWRKEEQTERAERVIAKIVGGVRESGR